MTAKIIVFDSPDNCGKTTQARLLRDELPNSIYVHSPFHNEYDNGYSCKLIRELLQNGLAISEPKTFQKLYTDNRKQWLLEDYLKYNKQYDFIIIDRWNTSTYIYSKVMCINDRKFLYELLNDGLHIDLQILFENENAITKRPPRDMFESERYQEICGQYSKYIKWLDKQFLVDDSKLLNLLPQNNIIFKDNHTRTVHQTHKLILEAVKCHFSI